MPKTIAQRNDDSREGREDPPLFLDKEGRWFHEGQEITHSRTCLLFSRSLRRDPAGIYYISVGRESSRVVVEDAPYVVKSVTIQKGPEGVPRGYILHLNDGTEEPLGVGSLAVSAQNVMYCKVKEGSERARFLRAAYYQICAHLQEGDGEGGHYWLPLGERRIVIHPIGRER